MTTSQLSSVMDITEDLNEIEILVEYFNMRQKCLKDLCELTFFQDFPQNATNNYRKHIIKYMLDKYVKSTCMINKHPDLLVTFTFKFRMEDAHVRQVTLSNHMQFRNDILTICFLQHLLYIPKYLMCKVVIAMMFIMVNKYDINFYSPNPVLKEITFTKISLSYMSIYLDILYNNFLNYSDITRAFPYFNLPPMIYAPLIVTIFPMFDDPPIAILMVISLTIYETCHPHKANTSLVELYKRIVYFHNTMIPEKIKLRLCRRYNIVVLEEDEFKFAPCFAKYRQKAKDIISERRSEDPDLKDILSII